MKRHELDCELAGIETLVRTVKPAEAEARMRNLIRHFSAAELRQFEPALREAIDGFRPSSMSPKKRSKIMGLLDVELDQALASIREREEADLAVSLLAKNGQEIKTASRSWTELDLEAALETTGKYLISFRELVAQFPAVKERLSEVASPGTLEAFRSLTSLLQSRGATARREIDALKDGELGRVHDIIKGIATVGDQFCRVFPNGRSAKAQVIADVELTAARRLVWGTPPPVLAWQPEVSRLVRGHCEHLLELPKVEESTALAVAVLLFPEVSALVVQGRITAGIVGLSCAIRAYSIDRPKLYGTTRFDSLSEEDLILAARYANDTNVNRLIESENIRSLQGLRNRLDDHPCQQFQVNGLQPRIAELAFKEVFQSVTNLNDSDLQDENILALKRAKAQLPADDFSCHGRRFDVKSNLCRFYAYRLRERTGLRGFQIGWKKRSPTAELAGFVFSDASDTQASWTFVGFCAERDVPLRDGRAAPFQFALPEHFDFPKAQPPDTEARLLKLLGAFDSVVHRSDRFGPGDHMALSRSLQARLDNERMTERSLWDEATSAIFDLRSRGGTEPDGGRLLDMKQAEAESQLWLFRMAAVQGRPLLSRWITEVLNKLNKHWGQIRCPQCHQTGRLRLKPNRIKDSGTITGQLACACGFQTDDATLITHCWKCGTYPLVIGRNGPHGGACLGLLCSDANCGGCRCNIPPKSEHL